MGSTAGAAVMMRLGCCAASDLRWLAVVAEGRETSPVHRIPEVAVGLGAHEGVDGDGRRLPGLC